MDAPPAVPKRPLKGILRHPGTTQTAGAATAVQADGQGAGGGGVGGAAAPPSQTEELRYDPADRSNQAALASFALCALCGLAVVVSAAAFYTSRASAGGEEVTPAVELTTSSTANVSGEVTKAMLDARGVEFSVTSAEASPTADAEDTSDEERTGKNETPTPLDELEKQRAPTSVKWANFSKKSVKKVS